MIKDSTINEISNVIKEYVAEIRSFMLPRKELTGPRIPKIPKDALSYCEVVDKYIENIDDSNTTPVEFYKALEESHQEWVSCFNNVFKEYKPKFARSIYRGLRFNNVKNTRNFSPADESKKDEYKKFLDNYEDVQGEGRHTLNSLLADYMDRKQDELKFIESSISNINLLNDETTNLISLNLTEELVKILIHKDDFNVIEKIENLSSDNTSITKDFLKGKRTYAFNCAKWGPEITHKELSIILTKFAKVFYNIDDTGFKNEEIFLEILQILQGICIFLEYFEGSLIAMLTREEDNDSRYSCVGEFFIFDTVSSEDGEKNEEFFKTFFPIIDLSQRYFFRKVLFRLQNNTGEYDSLVCALQNDDEPKKICEPLKNRVYNFDSLAGVIQLAEKIRPFAIHEGKQQNFTFIIGYPYLHKDRLEIISNFADKPVKWFTPTKKREPVAITKANEAFYKARARIIGNGQILQRKGVALFVNCIEVTPTLDCIVRPHPRGLSSDKTDIVDVMTDIEDVFIVKILGQRKIEIFHKGKKILVWSHVSATWDKENNWDDISLASIISNKLQANPNKHETIGIVAKTIYKISQMQNEGASFVISNQKLANEDLISPSMTVPFPDLSEGNIDNIEKLYDVAIEDGGTLICLSDKKFSGRRQWLPFRTDEQPNRTNAPFWYENFIVPREGWVEMINSKEWSNKLQSQTYLDISNEPSELYGKYGDENGICRYEFLKKAENGSTRYLKNPFRWQEWYKILSWGTRHISSMGMSACLWEKAVVIVISADSSITVFYQGTEESPSNE